MHLIRPYTGEYLVNPVPLHIGGNWCSHACFYCFANLNQPNRSANYQDAQLFASSSAGIRGYLKSKNYQLLCSNDSDPFAKSNVEQFLQVRELMAGIGKTIAYQTRGGEHAMRVLSEEKPTMVYISVTTDNEATIKANEPGAPSYASRMELVKACIDAGHFVILGVNPLVPHWWDDIYREIERWQAMGVGRAWVGHLHFGNQQIVAMPESRRVRHAKDVAYGRAKTKPDDAVWESAIRAMRANGINVFDGPSSIDGGFWSDYFSLGFDWFPTLDGLFDVLKQKGGGKPVAFTFDWFNRWADVFGDFKSSQFKEYLVQFGRTIRNEQGNYKAHSIVEANSYIWDIAKYRSALNHDNIGLLLDGDDVVADGEKDVLVFHPDGVTGSGVNLDQVAGILD